MLALEHDVFLELGIFNLIVLNQNIFPYHLNGIELLVELELSQENFAKSALP